ncbi:MAG: ROK family protein [Bacteroidales bacterium]|nr:ROK family protein [Bacteroidales bacterium]
MILGIDIGGTTITFGLVSGADIVKRVRIPSFPADATLEETLEYLSDGIASVMTPEIERIGVGVPTLVDVFRGIVYNAANIPSWKEVHLKEYLEDRFSIPVSVNNDANCFALGAAAKVGRPDATMVGVTLGTGTGVGIVTGGKLFCGDHCGAGEVCSLPYNDDILEAFCSKQFFENRGWNSKKADEAARSGDSGAISLFKEFGMHLGYLLSVIMYTYDPAVIVLGGGVANGHSLFYDSMMDSLRRHYVYPHVLDDLDIRIMADEEPAIVGATLL